LDKRRLRAPCRNPGTEPRASRPLFLFSSLCFVETQRATERSGGNGNRASPRVARGTAPRPEKRSKLAALERRIDEFDKSIAKPSRKIADIDAALADPKLYDRDPARVATLGKERAEAVSALAAEDQWLALSSDYDSAMAEG